jgi:hypothetical protein
MDLDANGMLASLLVSTVGLGFFVFGKKQQRAPQLVVGLALMVFPCFVSGPLLILGLGAGLILLVPLALRLGL